MALWIDAITVSAIDKRYASRHGTVNALDAITFAVDEGEFVAVVGPSGCGKSTLLKILAGLLPATGGEAMLRGTQIAGPRRDIGVVFQSPVLFPWRTVLDNVLLPVDVQRLDRARHERVALDLIKLVGLDGFEHATRGSSRAACSSAWRSRAASCTTRPCCSWTSRSARSTP